MKILITGGGGFIGSFLLNQLSVNHKLISIDHGSRYKILEKKLSENVEFVKGDITDKILMNQILKKGIDVIIHLAGVLGNSACMNNPSEAILSHVHGTQILTREAKKYKVKKLIFASSQAVYSTFKIRKNPLNEKMKLCPDDLYGTVKTMAESNIQDSGLDFVILRFANVYGYNPHSKQKGGPIENFINSVFQKSPISVFGSGKQKIDYINIKDIGDCIEMIIQNTKLSHEVFNVGSGKLNSIEDIAKIISANGKKLCGYSTKIKKTPAPKDKIWPDRLMSIRKIKTRIGWKPKISIEQGIDEILENRNLIK